MIWASNREARENGFALLLVVWVVAILAVLAAGFAATTRSDTRLARNLAEGARARALAEAGVSMAIAGLIATDPRHQWRADGAAHVFSFGGGSIRVRVEDEGGKIDLNTSPPELIAGLCNELGIDSDVQGAILQAVIARRTVVTPRAAQAFSRLNSFLTPFTVPQPAARRDPKAIAFGTVDQLRQVSGVDQASFELLRPYITVYAQSALVNPSTAPREVLLAIPGIDPRQVDQYLALRMSRTPGQSVAPPPLAGAAKYLVEGALISATIIADATTDTGASFSRRAVISLTGTPGNPAQILEWRQDVAEAAK